MIYSFRKGEPKKGYILIVHGLGEHIGRYERLIEDLIKIGFRVIGFDHPGHGKSGGKRGDTSIEDIIKIIDNLTSDIPKFHIFGHSLGGLIAVRYTEEREEKVKTLIISAPALYIKVDPLTSFIANTFGKIFPSVTISNKLDPEYLSRNKKVIEKCMNDPLMHSKISFRLGLSMMRNINLAHEKAGYIKIPVLILLPTEDRYVNPEGSRMFFNKLKVEDKKLVEFPGGYHELFEDEEYAERFYNTIYSWLNTYS